MIDWFTGSLGALMVAQTAGFLIWFGRVNEKISSLEEWKLHHATLSTQIAVLNTKLDDILRRLQRIEEHENSR